MKRKLLSLLLGLSLCLSLLPAALADGEVEFTDVPAGSWFEKGVATCAEQGVMVGTGEGVFSPEAELSQAECLTLAFRLYDLTRGQEHVIEKAPEKDKFTLTLADGTVLEGYGPGHGEVDCVFGWWFSPMGTRQAIYAMVPGWPGWSVWSDENARAGLEAQDTWLNAHPEVRAHGVPATITLNGVTYQGTTDCFMPVQPYVFKFDPERERAEEVNSILYDAAYRKAEPVPWWQDTAYTITQRGLEELFHPADFSGSPATRSFFAHALSSAAGELEKLSSLEALPDLGREDNEDIYALYEAGILTGTDELGTFQPLKTLTRAEAAVMVARVLDESQRVSPPLSYEEMVAQLATEENYTADWRSDGGYGAVLLRWKPLSPEDDTRDYELWLVPRDGKAKKLLLPSTVLRPSGHSPTHRAPDSLFISAGETKLVYAYDFTDQLGDGETVYHEAGRYIYTVDLKTGEPSVDVPFKPDNAGVAHGSYQQAIDDLKNGLYPLSVDRQLETKTCSLLMGHISAPHGGYYALKLVFKPGSQPGDGMEVSLPQPRINFWDNGSAPHTLEISEDEGFLTYAYHFDRPASGDYILHEAGDYVYTVDLNTGTIAEEILPLGYDAAMPLYTQEEGYAVERTLESPLCTALLRYRLLNIEELPRQYRSYDLVLVYKDGASLPAGTARFLTLPQTTTAVTASNGYGFSERKPDQLELSSDGTKLIYTYHFSAPTFDLWGDLTHEAGTYTYTVDLNTGVATEAPEPLARQHQSFVTALERLQDEVGYWREHVVDNGSGAVVLLRTKEFQEDEERRDYELYLIRQGVSPQVQRLLLPSTQPLPDGSAPTTRRPDSLGFSSDGGTLVYTYRFEEELKKAGTLLHGKGTYTYSVDIASGELEVTLEDPYELALAKVLSLEDFHADRQIEAKNCTIVTGMGKAAASDRAYIALIYKEASLPGAGATVWLPTYGGRSRYDSVLPHTLSVSEDETTLTYTYHFDEALYDWSGALTQKAGDHIYTVDLSNGTVNEEYIPKE